MRMALLPVAVALLLNAALSVAQPVAPVAPPASGGVGTAASASVFDGYRPMRDQAVEPWRETNDRVGRVGGWRTYAREAAAATAAAASAPATSASATPVPTSPMPAASAVPAVPGGPASAPAHHRHGASR